MRKNAVSVGVAVFFCAMLSSSLSRADAFGACVNAKTAFDRIDRCSAVILHSRRAAQLGRAYLRRGNAYVEVGRFAEAVSDYSALIQLNPTIAGYYDNRQFALKSMGRLREALDDANMTIHLAPTYSFGYRSRGNVYDSMGRYDWAIADYTKGLSIEPLDAGLLIDRGKALAKAGRDREAIADFSRALEIDSNAMVALRERGLVYKKLEDFAAATADLTLFNRFEPKDQEVVRAIGEMQAAALSPKQPKPKPSFPQETSKIAPSETPRSNLSGTGFFINSDGYVLTNAHVVENCASIRVTADQSAASEATLVARDVTNDLAVLRTAIKPAKAAGLRSSIRLGETVEAFGFPLTSLLSSSGNFTVGNVTALAGIGDDSRYLQISTPVQPGNSGGPLLDQNGNVVGVVAAKLNALNVMVATNGDVPQNVNFAIKGSLAMSFLESNRIPLTEGIASQQVPPLIWRIKPGP